jgi:hypothetical protein
LDEYIVARDPLRVVDEFVEELDLMEAWNAKRGVTSNALKEENRHHQSAPAEP